MLDFSTQACADSGACGGVQLMDNNLILPGGAIVVDNTLMKVCSQALAPLGVV